MPPTEWWCSYSLTFIFDFDFARPRALGTRSVRKRFASCGPQFGRVRRAIRNADRQRDKRQAEQVKPALQREDGVIMQPAGRERLALEHELAAEKQCVGKPRRDLRRELHDFVHDV